MSTQILERGELDQRGELCIADKSRVLSRGEKSYADVNINLLTPLIHGILWRDKRAFRKVIENGPIDRLVAATGCDEKATMMFWLLNKMTPGLLDGVKQLEASGLDYEPDNDDSLLVARYKALVKRAQLLSGTASDGKNNLAVIGTDGVSKIGAEGQEKHTGKLERLSELLGRPLNNLEIQHEWTQLLDNYCYAPTGPRGNIRLCWDFGLHLVNGHHDNQFSERYLLEIIAQPIDPELLDIFVLEALNNGLFYKSSFHFAAIECLIAAGNIQTVALAPQELLDQGYAVAQMRQRVNPRQSSFTLRELLHSSCSALTQKLLLSKINENMITAVLRSVLTTTPDTRINL